MNLTNEQLNLIEEYSSFFMTVDEIAVLIGVDVTEFTEAIQRRKSKVHLAYKKGQTLTKLEIRKNVVKLAKHGSPQAELLADKYMTDQELKENG